MLYTIQKFVSIPGSAAGCRQNDQRADGQKVWHLLACGRRRRLRLRGVVRDEEHTVPVFRWQLSDRAVEVFLSNRLGSMVAWLFF